ncbi:MAG: galactose mutarotase [Oscillospiraceae bacterium]|jgi:aldose 1-epimerase|nr:galactose mutarotase [Oscillospiraceae bacterium]
MRISSEPFGLLADGREVVCYTLENGGLKAEILNYGGIVRSLSVPDRAGRMADVVLGQPSLERCEANPECLGAIIGRNANRISGARCQIDDDVVELEANNGANNLHSGANGLHHRLFSAEVHTFSNLPALILSHTVEDGSDGFPGNLIVTVAYALTEDNALMIDYRAVCDKDTVVNLTNHSYFNLAGHDGGNIYGHILELDAPFYTPNTAELIPTGEIISVKDTPFDFYSSPKPVGKDIHSALTQLRHCGGYDHNFVLSGTGYRKIASVTEPESGRVMTVFTDLPGVQLYTSNAFDGEKSYKDGVKYQKHGGLCLETQFFPNAPNIHHFPSPFFIAGEEYTSTTTFQFSVK